MQPSLFEVKSTRQRFQEKFRQAYNGLNAEQKNAVNQIEGPVMVIAGPGTGKTQILATRIGKILLDTDASPHNILCLTYTDAATISMRNRLVQLIGPEAHRVHVHTFHGFCNQVIQENLGLFGNYRQLEPISDLERIDLYQRLIDQLPNDHRLKRLKGDPQFEMGRLQHLFSLMKKENYSIGDLEDAVDHYLEELLDDPDMYYKVSRGSNVKGDLKQKEYDKVVHRMEDLKAGVRLFPTFQQMMADIGRYDYEDMISWVIDAFETDDDLLLQYQERYQYFLVDEFQDTNGAQKRLLDLMISFWEESPNVFAVGDDDQAIYKFQGANMGNIIDFRSQYNPHLVVLVKNYRSRQGILDAAMNLIDYNDERIVKEKDFGLDKDLESMLGNISQEARVSITSYSNSTQELAAIVDKLEAQYNSTQDLSTIAILYRNHRQVEKLVEVLEKKQIPLNIKRRIDILKMPLVRNILNILTYIDAAYSQQGFTDKLLFEILHYNFFGIKSADIARLIWYVRQQQTQDEEDKQARVTLNSVIGDKALLSSLGLTSIEEISFVHDLMDKWIADLNDVTLQVLFQNVINEGHILKYILSHPDKSWLLQVLGTLFDLIKDETTKEPDLSLSEFLETLAKMKDHRLPLSINKIISADNGVHFLTAHSAKGLEFEEVLIIGVTKDIWDNTKNRGRSFTFPTSVNTDNDTNIEDERRLMYVAMTRAKSKLEISYSVQKEDGKPLGASQFVDELAAAGDIAIHGSRVEEESVIDFQKFILKMQDKEVSLIDHDLIDRMLEGYKLSVTGLNKYLKCPLTFYFESVLRVPMARTKYLGFGRAIHHALEYFHHNLNTQKEAGKDQLLFFFKEGMNNHRAHFTPAEYKDMTAYGVQVLGKYFDKHLVALHEKGEKYALEVKIDNAHFEDVPIKGVLDRVTIGADEVLVTDFKTGNPTSNYTRPKLKPPNDKKPLGGDYWRQIVFYKILLESDRKYGWNMTTGIMDFVEPERRTDKLHQTRFTVTKGDIEIVGQQITDTWSKIRAHEFEKGCGEDDCAWCEFVSNDYVVDFDLIAEEGE